MWSTFKYHILTWDCHPGQPGLVFDMEVGGSVCGRGLEELELDDP